MVAPRPSTTPITTTTPAPTPAPAPAPAPSTSYSYPVARPYYGYVYPTDQVSQAPTARPYTGTVYDPSLVNPVPVQRDPNAPLVPTPTPAPPAGTTPPTFTPPSTGGGSTTTPTSGTGSSGTNPWKPSASANAADDTSTTDTGEGLTVGEAQQKADQANIARILASLNKYSNVTAGDNGMYYGTDYYGNRTLLTGQKLINSGTSSAGDLYQAQLNYSDMMKRYGQMLRSGQSRYLGGYNPNQVNSTYAGQ